MYISSLNTYAGSFEHIAPNIQCPRSFFEIDLEIWHVFHESLPSRSQTFICRQKKWPWSFWDIWVLRCETFPAKRICELLGTHTTCANNQHLRRSPNTSWACGLLCGKPTYLVCEFCVVASQLSSFCMESALGVTYDVILDLRVQIFQYLPETYCGHALWNTCNRLVLKKMEILRICWFLTETPDHRWPFRGRDTFSHQGQS